jgi:hypothetical protein
MNNIGFGFFCFGDEYYYKGTVEKINNILNAGYHCYILTEDVEYFTKRYVDTFVHIISYDRAFKSYYDKVNVTKHVLKEHDICILIDSDADIKDYSFLKDLKEYNFKYGISYIDTLINHSAKRELVKDLIDVNNQEWQQYVRYAEKIYPNYGELPTMWEYFLVFNKVGISQKKFYSCYEKLQITKEFSDLYMNKKINGAGEGISIQISAKLSESDIQKDEDLYLLMKDKIKSISKAHTPRNEWPHWMR